MIFGLAAATASGPCERNKSGIDVMKAARLSLRPLPVDSRAGDLSEEIRRLLYRLNDAAFLRYILAACLPFIERGR